MQKTAKKNSAAYSLYLANKEYFDSKIVGIRMSEKSATIAIAYITSDKGSRIIGKKLGKSDAVVRQHAMRFLRIVKALQGDIGPVTENVYDKLMTENRSLKKENESLKSKLSQIFDIAATAPIPASPKTLQTIFTDGVEGYLITTLKAYLNGRYQDFFSWYQGKRYMGGIYEGEYYFLKEHVDEYLAK